MKESPRCFPHYTFLYTNCFASISVYELKDGKTLLSSVEQSILIFMLLSKVMLGNE